MAGLALPAIQLSDHLGDNGTPTCLMTGSNARSTAAVEVFIEQEEITPERIILELFNRTVERTSTVGIAAENANQAFLQLQ